jgi:hypothetical protein
VPARSSTPPARRSRTTQTTGSSSRATMVPIAPPRRAPARRRRPRATRGQACRRPDPVLIGRDPQNDLVLDDHRSRQARRDRLRLALHPPTEEHERDV